MWRAAAEAGSRKRLNENLAPLQRYIAGQVGLPEWVDVDTEAMSGVFKAVPERDDILPDINENLVVELYSK